MKSLLEGSPLFKKIMVSILLACVFFMSLLSLVVYYSNEILEDDLLAKQTEFELRSIMDTLAQDPNAVLPKSASLSIYLASRQSVQPIPAYIADLPVGIHHDIQIENKAYHILVVDEVNDTIYIQTDITEIERSEELLTLILFIAWVAMIVVIFFIARILSKKLSGPVARLSRELSQINPDQRGIQLSDQFEDDDVGKIAQAFDLYTQKMDSYVERQIAFAAMASHELRSPLTIVQTSADLIACQHQDPGINPHLDKIQRASHKMANMIHALLAVTRDKPTQNADEITNLSAVIEETLETANPEIIAKQIEINNKLERKITVNADNTLVTVVLSNLINNAVKHGQQSIIVIEMKAQALFITDNGIGISTEDLNSIFKFGFRGQNSQGYGIGLYISKLICDQQGWKLSIEKNQSGGTTAIVGFS